MNFDHLNIIRPITSALKEAGYAETTEIQSKAIPKILAGKDILGCAQTGTGKTAAFAIPLLQRLEAIKNQRKIKALILAPTRELALQIEENLVIFSKFLQTKCLSVYGGVSQVRQVAELKKGVDVLIATPGRLLDLMNQGFIDLSGVETLVLDEADHMLDIGFIHDIRKVLYKVPAKRQTLFFTATMPVTIRKLAKSILHQPVEITITPELPTAETISQFVYFVEKKEKAELLILLIKSRTINSSLVFTRTKFGADKLVRQLTKTGIYAAAIHGNKTQNTRQKALNDFKKSRIRVLVATDIAARGIDIDELPYVVNYELPHVPQTYVHRIGRTGRAGRKGMAISFCDLEQRNELKNIQHLIGFKIPVMKRMALLNNN